MIYDHTKQTSLAVQDAKEKIVAELANEGFGVLTEIDVKATLKKKLGVEHGAYVILGVCNPQFAYQALQIEKKVGLFMPCNVIIYEEDGKTFVSAILPTAAMKGMENPALDDIARRAEEKLKNVIDRIE